ncbi:albusnodin/ikarugamycin family macrolactam cyclase [Actinocrispum wychmicini]|uniref:albusnodin/ikarugamycin family macrolactam cyclase n=1 Tax=Actinocrispum wychmicini TaxID=1213861 RepID=UPI0014048F4E|nr:albusnodin/ikarugamycin family macrolactam cyclase [Actinocrispum wychmicini]
MAVLSATPGPETRTITVPGVEMIVIGHCLATDALLADGLTAVRVTGKPRQLTEWLGCYSLALLFSDEVTLIADPVGQFPLYVCDVPDGALFGTNATDIAARANARLDRIHIAAGLICPGALEVSDYRTPFHQVKQIPPGHLVRTGYSGRQLEKFDPVEPDKDLTFADAAERLRLSLTAAVSARATETPFMTTDFSGGIDSTSLALLAHGWNHGVKGLTYRSPANPVHDDPVRAENYLRFAPGLRHHWVDGTAEDLPYQDLVPARDDPHVSSIATGPLRARLRLAAELGSAVHLVGEGGDVVLGAPPAYLADLARRGDMGALWRHCVAWARIRQRSPLALARHAVALAATSRRRALLMLAASVGRATVPGEPLWEAEAIGYWDVPQTHWLAKPARAELAAHIHAVADRTFDTMGVGDIVARGQLRTQVLTQRAVRHVGDEFGIAVHAPFLDSEVVRACLSLPAFRRVDPTTPKPLLRTALSGLVPEPVLTRPTKGDYTRSAYLGIRRAAPALRRLLADSAAADHGLINPVPVRATLEGAVQGLPTPWGALNQVFAVEVWLRDVSRKVAGV